MLRAVPFLLTAGALLWPGGAYGDLPRTEKRFVETLINDYRVLTIAEHYCRKRLKEVRSDTMAVASLRYYLEADIPRLRGDLAAFEKASLALAKQFPKHPRAGRSRLDVLKAKMDQLTLQWEDAQKESDLARRKELVDQVVKTFQEQVRPGFKSLIKDLNEAVAKAERDEAGLVKDVDLALLRNETELFWILALVRFARFLQEDRFADLRKKIYAEALKAAEFFVEERPTFFVLRFIAQIQRGLCYAKLGRLTDAIDAFETLFVITPPVAPSHWDHDLIVKICEIRLQAYLYAMRVCNEAGDYERAARISDKLFAGQRPPFNLAALGPKEPSLRPYWVEAQLEAGVARAGVGRPQEAAKLIQQVINTYVVKEKQGDQEARTYVLKARGALARMVMVAGPIFPPDTILEAGKGYKAELNWRAARTVFQLGLGALATPEEVHKYAPLFLKEIAECSHLTGELREALFASLTALRHFGEGMPEQLRQRLANYAMAAADGLQEKEKNAAFSRLFQEAEDFFMRWGNPGLAELKKISDAIDLKNQGRFEDARKKLLAVKPTFVHQGKTKPFTGYWRARAEAADCLYQRYLKAKKDQKDLKDAEKLRQQAIAELTDALKKAEAAQPPQLDGVAAAVYYLSSIYLEEGREEPDKALELLKRLDTELKSAKEYADMALYNYVVALAHADKKEEAWAKFQELKKRFPESVEWARAGYDLYFFYDARGEPCMAAAYADAYLSHPRVKQMQQDLDVLFAIAQTFADCGKPEYLPRAKDIFEKFVDSPDRDRRITALLGLVKLLIARKQYEEAAKRGEELLKQKQEEDQWVPQLYHDLKRAYVGIAIRAVRAGQGAKAVDALEKAEKYMRQLVVLVKGAADQKLRRRDIAGYRESMIIYYRYWHELLQIWYAQRRYNRVIRYGGMLLERKPPFLPGDLVKRIEKIVEAAKARLKK